MAKPNANERDFEVRMASQCPACLKTNPADAHYCYYDGRPLSKERQDGPLHVGALPFPMAFYFADGQACTNFNQLALACDERWEEAKGLLAQGFWPTFFAGIGRHDLAALAKRAVEEPDRDLGLSQLLEKFPADPEALRPPNLTLGSMEENLGVLSPGTDRTFELTILNRGMLVLRGMVLSNSDWLVFGDRTGPSQKMFQTRSICTIKVRVLGHKLRAGSKPLQGEIVVDTNGGMRTLLVRADVPIVPFPKGGHANDALAGAKSPHEIALRAKQFSNEAAILFEQGAVKAWYASNGWIYPIEGSEGSGKGAVQQFFEALGLTKPPRLAIDSNYLRFKGRIGERLSARATLSTEEAKPVYAHAWSNQDWVTFGPIKYLGNKVRIQVEVVVPALPGQTVLAEVIIQGNGKQQFVVPLSVTVENLPVVEEVITDYIVEEEPQGLEQLVRKGIQAIKNLFGPR
jgi:hypothetical protein